MINHVRTLLLNQTGGSPVRGEQYVPPEFAEIPLSTQLMNVREQLFGTNPSRETLNYRLAQYLTLIHATELREFVTALDPRLTYPQAGNAALFGVSGYQLVDLSEILQRFSKIGAPAHLELFGFGPAEPWQTFRNLYERHTKLAYRLGAVVLALAYRTEEIRNAPGQRE